MSRLSKKYAELRAAEVAAKTMPAPTAEYPDAPQQPSKAERVEYIADLMAQGRYRTRLTNRSLMGMWGLSGNTLDLDAGEASRKLKADPSQVQELRDRLRLHFEAIAQEAMTRCSNVTGLPDYNAAIKAMELYGIYSGLAMKQDEGQATAQPVKIEIVTTGSKKT